MGKITLDIETILKKIKNVKIFHYLKHKEQEEIIKTAETFEFAKNDKIIAEGEISPYFFVVIKGSVSVMVDKNDKKNVYICTIGEGEVFGETSIFINLKRTANIIANEETQVLQFERGAFIKFIQKYPGAGIKILMLIIYSLLYKLREANQELAFERKSFVDQNDIDDIVGGLLDKKN